MTLPPQPPPSGPIHYGPGVPPLPPKKKPVKIWWIVGGVVVALCCVLPSIFGLIGVLQGGGAKTQTSGNRTGNVPAPAAVESSAPAEVVTTSAAPPPPPPSPAGPATSFGPGTYEVGVDIKAGTYKCVADRFGGYWERARNASGEFDAIIANDATQAGATTIVTVKAKEFFKTSGLQCTIR